MCVCVCVCVCSSLSPHAVSLTSFERERHFWSSLKRRECSVKTSQSWTTLGRTCTRTFHHACMCIHVHVYTNVDIHTLYMYISGFFSRGFQGGNFAWSENGLAPPEPILILCILAVTYATPPPPLYFSKYWFAPLKKNIPYVTENT